MGSIVKHQHSTERVCPNCGGSYSVSYKYCPYCSQKSGLGLHSVWHMIGQFFANTFNYEAKITQTAIGLVKPGFLTREYLATRRVNYLSPIRVFVVLMFMLFLLLSLAGVDNLRFTSGDNNSENDTIKGTEIDRSILLRYISPDSFINQHLTDINEWLQNQDLPVDKKDQIQQHLTAAEELMALNLDKTRQLTFFNGSYTFKQNDIYQLSVDEFIEKYQVSSLLDQLTFRALLRFTQDPKGFVKFLFGNMTWAIFLDVLLMATLFKLFYPKTRYVVHFVYHLHLRSFIFLGLMLIIGLYALIPSGWTVGLSIIALLIYIAISLQRVYPRHKLKTTVYFILFIPLASISFFTATFIVLFLSSIMF